MAALNEAAEQTGRCYLTDGAAAVLLGWRGTTIDVDLKLVPEQDAVLRAIPGLKDELQVNVELAAPGDFIPLPAGWEERSLLAEQGGRLAFYHFDPYAQALAKLERDHARDRDDVRALIRSGLVDLEQLSRYFEEIEPRLYRFPAIDPPAFRERVEQARTIEPDLGKGPSSRPTRHSVSALPAGLVTGGEASRARELRSSSIVARTRPCSSGSKPTCKSMHKGYFAPAEARVIVRERRVDAAADCGAPWLPRPVPRCSSC